MIPAKGISFNGIDLSMWLTANPVRPILPPVVRNTIEVPGRNGTRLQSVKLDEQTIPVKVKLRAKRGDDITTLRHMLASMLMVKEPAPLILGDDPTRHWLCTLDGSSDLNMLTHTGSTVLNFVAPDPVSYGEMRKAELGQSGKINVSGTWETLPKITLTEASGNNVSIMHVNTGDYIKFTDLSLDGTQKIVIDCEKEHCIINGTSADKYVDLLSDYISLQPGLNELRSTSGNLTIEWTERWL